MSTHHEAPIIGDTYEDTIWWQLKAKLTEFINFQTCCHGMYELKLAYLWTGKIGTEETWLFGGRKQCPPGLFTFLFRYVFSTFVGYESHD